MASIHDIPFRNIPRQSALFLSYLDSAPAALRFYQQAPTWTALENAVRALQKRTFPRAEMASILRAQNRGFGCDAKTLEQIDALEHPESVAVVTGQQVGLFTGPLYTVYKALTAIRMAEALKQSGIKAVPVFWMETEDHDLAEVTQRLLLNPDSSLQSIDYRHILFTSLPTGSVGSVRFDETILPAVQDYLSNLPDGPGKAQVQVQLESTYQPGSTFTRAFGELLCRILSGSGLILFDPSNPEAKRLTSPVFQTAIREEQALREALLRRNTDLEDSGFHVQVRVPENSTVLFFIENGERRALEKRWLTWGLKNTDRTFSSEELLRHAAQTPERFSPNVLLRPLVQDHLFPTVAYVGGSAELAYFAQAEVLYRLYNRPMPVLWPRNSFTLVEPEIGDAMDRFGIGLEDCFHGQTSLMEKVLCSSGLSKASAALDELRGRLDAVLTDVKPDLQAVEIPLARALETARRKILYNVEHLKLRVARMDARRNASVSAVMDSVLNHCYPNQALQERALGIQHFHAGLGLSVLDEIRSALDIHCFAHRVLRFGAAFPPGGVA